MAEPTGGDFFGIRVAGLVAGFFGAVVSLSFIQGLTRTQAVISAVTGFLASAYLTPLAVLLAEHYFAPLPTVVQNGFAFIVGLIGMSLLGGLVKGARLFRDDPSGFLRRLRER